MSEQDDATTKFLPLSALVEAIMAQSKEEFLEKHPESLLLLDNPGDDAENASFQTIDLGKSSSVNAGKRDELLKKLSGAGSCVYVLKKEPNKFASMITVGRAANNGLRINVGSVSKFHAYFTHVARDRCWYVADAHSSNGTFIDGKELPPSHGKQPIKNACILRFGPDVTAQYFDADGIWEMLNGSSVMDEGSATVAVRGEAAQALQEEVKAKKAAEEQADDGEPDASA